MFSEKARSADAVLLSSRSACNHSLDPDPLRLSLSTLLYFLRPLIMLSTTEDPRKLEITLRHYEEDYTSQAVKTAKLQAEIVHLRANIDYLEQCLAEERAQHKSESVPVEASFNVRFPCHFPPLTSELSRGSLAI